MPSKHVEYDRIASTYNRRFDGGELEIAKSEALLALARSVRAGRILEVGCGTGRWLSDLAATTAQVYGLDRSAGMLREARGRSARLALAQGCAERLPFPDGAFDLVYCVNAIHHFDDQSGFVAEARRLLRPGGALAVLGMDPHLRQHTWYIYDYFEGTRATDLQRFPSWGMVLDWMAACGFTRAEWRLIVNNTGHKVGRAVLDDPFLQKHAASQLALLSDAAYAAGRRRIDAALAAAEAAGETLVFPVVIPFGMAVGYTEPALAQQGGRLD